MYCENCGERLDDSAEFCPACDEKNKRPESFHQVPIVGEKGVVAGDVYAGDRTEIQGNYNVTNIYNNIVESTTCAVCGKKCSNNQNSYQCTNCGQTICKSCFLAYSSTFSL